MQKSSSTSPRATEYTTVDSDWDLLILLDTPKVTLKNRTKIQASLAEHRI